MELNFYYAIDLIGDLAALLFRVPAERERELYKTWMKVLKRGTFALRRAVKKRKFFGQRSVTLRNMRRSTISQR